MEYYSYEQLISAALANYKKTITVGELYNLGLKFKRKKPNTEYVYDTVHFINEYVSFAKEYIYLKKDALLDSNVTMDDQVISLKDYLNLIAGEKLVSFMQEEYSELYGQGRN